VYYIYAEYIQIFLHFLLDVTGLNILLTGHTDLSHRKPDPACIIANVFLQSSTSYVGLY